jgi:chromate reductase, NAD(P)H dehydrogenase (quinone)
MRLFFLFLIATASLFSKSKILLFSGSVREGSYNQKLIQDAAKIVKQKKMSATIVNLNDYPMPIYNADFQAPKGAKRFCTLAMKYDAFIISSPEYNHSIPALLKNAIDWASPSAFKNKPVAIMSASSGKKGGVAALGQLRTILEDAGARVIPLQLSIPLAHDYFLQRNRPENPELRQAIEQLLSALESQGKEEGNSDQLGSH